MQRSAAAAMKLDPRLAEAHAANGWVHAFERRWSDAAQAFEQAIRLDPRRILTCELFDLDASVAAEVRRGARGAGAGLRRRRI
jgi:hypothetical protein